MLAFDSNEKPIVGQQVTMTWRAPNVGAERLSLILGQAKAGNCDVIAWGRKHGYLYRDGRLLRDNGRTVALDEALRRERALTYTAVPRRVGTERELRDLEEQSFTAVKPLPRVLTARMCVWDDGCG